MGDLREHEFNSWGEAGRAAALLFAEGHDVWIRPQHRTAPVEHDVWIVAVKR